jgi:teichuronic acid exporter
MSVEKTVFRGAGWLGMFKSFSQIFSWCITIIVARILSPKDYGIMEMATVLTGYAAMFSELGLGSAIIQRKEIDDNELSSLFWLITIISGILAIFAIFAAYPTCWIFKEPRVIPITQAVSLLFVFTGLLIVPNSLLQKRLKFKQIGFFEMTGVFISSTCMLLIAKAGGGVWTLICGHIIREFVKLCFASYYCKWFPRLHFDFKSSISYLKFGITIALGGSFYYIYNKCDRFFAGKNWNAGSLGLYSFALELASVPTNKIVTIINQVSYAGFAKLQDQENEFNSFYLNIIKTISILVFPLYVGLFLVGEDIVKLFLNEKWFGMIFLFKGLCLVQILTSLIAVNNIALNAKGRPQRSLLFNIAMTVCLVPSFYFATKAGFKTILIPWFTVYIILAITLVLHTLKKLHIKLTTYLNVLKPSLIAVLLMTLAIKIIQLIPFHQINFQYIKITTLSINILTGALVYGLIIWLLDRTIFTKFRKLFFSK